MKKTPLSSILSTNTINSTQMKKNFSLKSILTFSCCQNNHYDNVESNHKMNCTVPTSNMNIDRLTTNNTTISSAVHGFKTEDTSSKKQKLFFDSKDFICCGKLYPKNQLFILGEGSQKILAKITETNLKSNNSLSNNTNSTRTVRNFTFSAKKEISPIKECSGKTCSLKKKSQEQQQAQQAQQQQQQVNENFDEKGHLGDLESSSFPKKEIFSLYDKGIKADNWDEITPEVIASHIAERLKCQILLDALCGVGGNTIQFAKHSNFVLAIDIDPQKTLYAQHNVNLYGVSNKVDFFTADFLKFKNLNASVVYIAPNELPVEKNEEMSIFKHLEPNMIDITGKALEISYSLAFKLPNTIDFEQLSLLFNKSFDKHETYSKRFSVEIEAIYVDDQLQCYMIYFGDCSSIDPEEEYELIYQYICDHELQGWSNKFPLSTVKKIIQNVGLHKSLKYLFNLSALLSLNGKYTESIFDAFVNWIAQENILTFEDVKKLNSIEILRLNQSGSNSFHSFSKMILSGVSSTNRSPIRISDKSLSKSSESSGEKSPVFFGGKKSTRKHENQSKTAPKLKESNYRKNSRQDKLENHDKEKMKQSLDFCNGDSNKGIEFEYYDRQNPIKNSFENNDIISSSYSISSGFFKDSYSEEFLSPNDAITFENKKPLNTNDNSCKRETIYQMTYEEFDNNERLYQQIMN